MSWGVLQWRVRLHGHRAPGQHPPLLRVLAVALSLKTDVSEVITAQRQWKPRLPNGLSWILFLLGGTSGR